MNYPSGEARTVADAVRTVIINELGCDAESIVPDARLVENLGADSLDVVELMMAFEEEFDIEIPDDDAAKLATIGDVIAYIEQRVR